MPTVNDRCPNPKTPELLPRNLRKAAHLCWQWMTGVQIPKPRNSSLGISEHNLVNIKNHTKPALYVTTSTISEHILFVHSLSL